MTTMTNINANTAQLARETISEINHEGQPTPTQVLDLFDAIGEVNAEASDLIHTFMRIQTNTKNGGIPVLKRLISEVEA